MKMVIQRHPRQPIQIWLRGPLSDEDIQILRQECLKLVNHLLPGQVWIHLEQMSSLSERELIVLHQVYQFFQQARFQLSLISRKKSLCQRLEERGLPARYGVPEPILNSVNVF